jgi:hypothetical protein
LPQFYSRQPRPPEKPWLSGLSKEIFDACRALRHLFIFLSGEKRFSLRPPVEISDRGGGPFHMPRRAERRGLKGRFHVREGLECVVATDAWRGGCVSEQTDA